MLSLLAAGALEDVISMETITASSAKLPPTSVSMTCSAASGITVRPMS
jgi:hypothetical protein